MPEKNSILISPEVGHTGLGINQAYDNDEKATNWQKRINRF